MTESSKTALPSLRLIPKMSRHWSVEHRRLRVWRGTGLLFRISRPFYLCPVIRLERPMLICATWCNTGWIGRCSSWRQEIAKYTKNNWICREIFEWIGVGDGIRWNTQSIFPSLLYERGCHLLVNICLAALLPWAQLTIEREWYNAIMISNWIQTTVWIHLVFHVIYFYKSIAWTLRLQKYSSHPSFWSCLLSIGYWICPSYINFCCWNVIHDGHSPLVFWLLFNPFSAG